MTMGYHTSPQQDTKDCIARMFRRIDGYWSKNGNGIGNTKSFFFKTIGVDLAYHDIHPPLYFWILHIWTAIVGTELWTGPVLNLLFFIITYILLYMLARHILGNALFASMLVITWGLSPAVFRVLEFTRQYSLLTLCAVFYVLMLLRHLQTLPSKKIFRHGGLTLSVMIGLLTHYHFALFVSGGIAFILIEAIYQKKIKRVISPVVCTIVGIGMAIALHPFFLHSLTRQGRQTQDFSFSEIPFRFKQVFFSFTSFYSPLSLIMFICFLGFWVSLFFFVFRYQQKQPTKHDILRILIQHRYILFLFSWVSLSLVMLYMLCLSPRHAMGERYLSFVYPLMVFLPFAMFLSIKLPARYILATCLCVGQLFYGLIDTYGYCQKLQQERANLASTHFLKSSVVLLDFVARGVLPTIAWHIPDTASVFAGPQDSLLVTEPETLLARLSEHAFYVSDLQYHNNSVIKREAIINMLKNHGVDVQPVNGDIYGVGQVYYLKPVFASIIKVKQNSKE